jgi:two-component system, chemotaxis family, response regulator Rcp1
MLFRRVVFRILVVDDSPVDAALMIEGLKGLIRECQVEWARDGAAALDFLRRRGTYAGAQRPHLILLDINMPRVTGLEALDAIKSDPDLRLIPVTVYSASPWPEDVRRSYQAHANAYVQKPTSLDGLERLIRAIEIFWMRVAILADDTVEPGGSRAGVPIAREMWEAKSHAMRSDEPADAADVPVPIGVGCVENRKLLDEFGAAVHDLLKLHEDQFRAIILGDSDSNRFDLLIHMANEKKQLAKYAYIRHVESHGCGTNHAVDQTRT